MTLSGSEPDPLVAPIRTAEVTVAVYRWDAWGAAAEHAFARARRIAIVVAVVVSAALGVAGLVLLPSAAKVSVVLYAPLVGGGVHTWLRAAVARRGLAGVVDEAHDLVVPGLVDVAGSESLATLLRNGSTLVTERSTMIVAHRRDALVALVASEYDLRDVPAVFPSAGGGP